MATATASDFMAVGPAGAVFSTFTSADATIATTTETTLVSLTLPAGTYVVNGFFGLYTLGSSFTIDYYLTDGSTYYSAGSVSLVSSLIHSENLPAVIILAAQTTIKLNVKHQTATSALYPYRSNNASKPGAVGIIATRISTGTAITPNMNTSTGGTITSGGGYRVHVLANGDTFTPGASGPVEILLVGGGGGGAGGYGGGGGAGGYLSLSNVPLIAGAAYPVVVGTGGAGGAAGGNNDGATGNATMFAGFVALGGGGACAGGAALTAGKSGASGGGGGSNAGTLSGGTAAGQISQGNNGGSASAVASNIGGGGGGGASAVGSASRYPRGLAPSRLLASSRTSRPGATRDYRRQNAQAIDRAAMQRPAKPRTPVRFRPWPPFVSMSYTIKPVLGAGDKTSKSP